MWTADHRLQTGYKESILNGQGKLCCYARRQLKMKLEFYKEEELEGNSVYSFKPKVAVKLRSTKLKRNSI